MRTRGSLVAVAIGCVMALALPAFAAGTHDQKGPPCTDIMDVQTALNEVLATGEDSPTGAVGTGEWLGSITVRLSAAPCDGVRYVVDHVIKGETLAGAAVEDNKYSVTLTASNFTAKQSGTDQWWEWSTSFKVSETSDGYEPTTQCNKVETLFKNRVADSSPDAGSQSVPGEYDIDAAGRACGLEVTSGGARSYGARSYG